LNKVVLDTNVIISALVFGGPPKQILKQIIKGHIILYISDEIIKEVADVLKGKKFKYPLEIVREIINELISISKFIEPKRTINIIKKDPSDNIILECASELECNFIISGDYHLLELKKFEGIPIIKPSDFLTITGESSYKK